MSENKKIKFLYFSFKKEQHVYPYIQENYRISIFVIITKKKLHSDFLYFLVINMFAFTIT